MKRKTKIVIVFVAHDRKREKYLTRFSDKLVVLLQHLQICFFSVFGKEYLAREAVIPMGNPSWYAKNPTNYVGKILQ